MKTEFTLGHWGWVKIGQDWTQFLNPSKFNYLNFRLINVECERDYVSGDFEVDLALCGFWLRSSFAVGKPSDKFLKCWQAMSATPRAAHGREKVNNIVAIQDDRVMADGRPAFAWWNEIQMLRQRDADIQKREIVLAERFIVLRIIEWAIYPLMGADAISDDLVIKVRRGPMIPSKIGAFDLAEHPEKYCEVMSAEPLPREEPRK